MSSLIRLGILVILSCSLFLLSGCGATPKKNDITWSDVNQKFVALERERLETVEELKNKPLISVKNSKEILH